MPVPALFLLWAFSGGKQSKTKQLHFAKATTVQLFAEGSGEQATPPVSIPGAVPSVHQHWPWDVKWGCEKPFYLLVSRSGLVQVEHSQTFYWLLAMLAWWTSSSCLWTTVHIRKKSPLDTGTRIQPYPQTPAALQTLPQQPGWDTRITAMSMCPGSLINRIIKSQKQFYHG